MASVTYWNRLEPRPRGESLLEPLRARLRDPLWLLARQWQVGEFQAADAGSPAHVELTLRTGELTAWRAPGGDPSPLGAGPLEQRTEAEPLHADLGTRIELGQTLERLLRARIADAVAANAVIGAFRTAYAVARDVTDALDPAEVTLRRVCGARAIDGFLVLEAAAAGDAVPPAVAGAERGAATDAVSALVDWSAATFGAFGDADGATWQAARLEQRFSVDGHAPDGASVSFDVVPSSDGATGWDAFDASASTPSSGAGGAGAPETRRVIPAHVRFRGMPNARFWDFEPGTTDFGAIAPDRRDLARLAVMEFMLTHSNDWFAVPVDVAVGSLVQVDTLLVHDVFGSLTLVRRTDASASPGFRMFVSNAGSAPAPGFLVVPPSVAAVSQLGAPLEEVRFVRDETASMVWAIEHTVENAVGEPALGRERNPAPSPPPAPPAGELGWTIESSVPEHWIPFVAVAVDAARGQIELERTAMLRAGSPPTPILPRGRVLNPSALGTDPYRVAEEEVPRAGVRVLRRYIRTRWHDGTTHLWLARERAVGFGEADSALQFDTV